MRLVAELCAEAERERDGERGEKPHIVGVLVLLHLFLHLSLSLSLSLSLCLSLILCCTKGKG